MPADALPEGLYEQLVTEALQAAIERARASQLHVDTEAVDGSLLRTLLLRQLRSSLDLILGKADDAVAIANQLALHLDEPDRVRSPAQVLLAVHRTPERPAPTSTPLSVSALLTGATDEPRLGLELEREFGSADEVDALVSFVTWEGWRRLQPALESFARRKGKLRLITTTYTGATDAEAVAAIAGLPGVSVHVSYEARRTRLHAKAWLFRRRSGFSTAWVGSANLSRAALSGGLEWTMKASAIDLPDVVDKFSGTFETLWNDDEFERFSPDDLGRLREAIARERGHATPTSSMTFFATLRPFPFQQEILDRLQSEREVHGRHRNLVVAATGTGKTLVAAFDYARQVPTSGLRPRLLFVAHRDELLQQSVEAFRHVLRDGAFGSRLGAGFEPDSYDHLFATVQSFASRRLAEQFPIDHWDYVVIDECHHSTAATYRGLVELLRPKELVGLTATPERTDGVDLLPFFGGRVAAEMRLWHALDRQLLAPFDYYGVADGTDLRAIDWRRGGYTVEGLDNLYTGNDHRADLVIERFRRHRGNVADARALGFCVSVSHAEFMARKFREAGIPAEAVHGDSNDTLRRGIPDRLRRRALNVVFTCDLYNEGVDLPFVDTLLFLRPTSSATVFLQQLGRGLRLDDGKTSCLVLDFIGQCRSEFRFDRLLTAITGLPRGKVAKAVEEEFPHLPSGCSLRLDPVARAVVLTNIKQALRGGPQQLAKELREHARRVGPDITLMRFLEDAGRPIDDVYSCGSFTSLRVAAGLDTVPLAVAEREIADRLSLLLHTDDPEQLAELRSLAETGKARVDRRALMIGYQLWFDTRDRFDAREVERRLAAMPRTRAELGFLADLLAENVTIAPTVTLPSEWSLQLHRAYERREILTAVGAWDEHRRPSSREGVMRVGDNEELFFVTLVKEEGRFSPSTRYRDYAISRELFHWQSQSGTPADGPVGRAYQTGSRRCWLFVRRTEDDPYRFLGPLSYVSHVGEKPMSITWRLACPMPARFFQQYASLVAA